MPDLVKMSILARRSGVPAATIKHYLREGLLPPPAVRSSRNMALYDAQTVPRIKAIKELQRKRYLPLRVIKKVLEGLDPHADDETTAQVIDRVLRETASPESRTRDELIAEGIAPLELEFLARLRIVVPEGDRYSGDDLALLRVLRSARDEGLEPAMLPAEILGEYRTALAALVEVELKIFRAGVLPRAGDRLAPLTESATRLSERLVVLLRRKLLLPTLRKLVEAESRKPRRRRPRR